MPYDSFFSNLSVSPSKESSTSHLGLLSSGEKGKPHPVGVLGTAAL